MSEILSRDQNHVTVLGGVTDDSNLSVTMLRVDPISKRLLVSATGSGQGSVTSVSVVSANGFAGTVANPTTTPAITLTTSITGLLQGNGTALSAVTIGTGLSFTGGTLSSTTTGTVTSVSVASSNGFTGSSSGGATPILTLATSITGIIKGNGTAMSSATDGTDYLSSATGITVSQSTPQTLGSTGSRLTKLWATDITVTNAITGSITGNAATVTTNANLTGAITSSGNATSLGSFTSANLSGALTDETGSGSAVFGTNPTIAKPVMNARNQTAQTYSPAGAGTATLDLSLADQHYVQFPAGNITVALSNDTNNQIFLVSLTQDSTGSRTVTWFTTIKWAGGTVPTLTTTANKRDTFGFIRTGSGTYDGFIIGQNI